MNAFILGFMIACCFFVTLLIGVSLGMQELKKQGKCPYCGQERGR